MDILSLLLLGSTGFLFFMAAYWDVRTTEFPDWLPYSIIIVSLALRGVMSLMSWDFSYILNSILIGILFLGFGMGLYYSRQWGDGDAWLLGSLGFAFPDAAGFAYTSFIPFPAAILFNFFFIAFFYLLVYSIALGLMSPDTSRKFIGEMREDLRRMVYMTGGFAVACVATVIFVTSYFAMPVSLFLPVILSPLLLLSVIIFMRYGRFVEANLFKRRVPASRIRVGDVLFDGKWRGLTEKEVRVIRKKGKPVWIKEGVRFAPAFVITIFFTLFYGNILSLFI
jgi:Flp pilus assembly protein protease CpaA